MIFTHSYGGVATREALRGLSKAERLSNGLKGGVIRVIYCSAIIAEDGQTASEVSEELSYDYVDMFHEDYMRQLLPEFAVRLFSDLPLREAMRHATRMTTHSLRAFSDPQSESSTYDKSIPSTFLLCALERVLPPEYQRERMEILKRQSGEDRVQIVEIVAGDCLNGSMPGRVAEIVGELLLSE